MIARKLSTWGIWVYVFIITAVMEWCICPILRPCPSLHQESIGLALRTHAAVLPQPANVPPPFQHKEEKKKDREKWSAVASQIQARMDKIDWKLKKRKERAYKVDCSSGYISNTLINSWTKKKITWQKIYTSTFSMTNDIYRKRSLKETNI